MSSSRSIQSAIPHLKAHGIVFEEGICEAELVKVEEICKCQLPSDYRHFLALALPVSGGFPNWRSESDVVLRRLLDRPWDGIKFDVEQNGFWNESWGARPQSVADAISVAQRCFGSVPILIPVRSKHYIPALSASDGTPVFSVRQSDVSVVGDTLTSYLTDFPEAGHTGCISHCVPFWSAVAHTNRIKVPILSEDHAGCIDEYNVICEYIVAQGRYARVADRLIIGTGIRVFYRPPATDREWHVFCLSKRRFGWLLCIPGLGYFSAPQADRINELCLTLLDQLPEDARETRVVNLNDEVRREFGLIAIRPLSGLDDDRESRLRFLESLGWREMSDGQQDEVWGEYKERLGHPIFGDEFLTSEPATTWDISFVYLRDADFLAELETDLTQKTLSALQDCVDADEEILALDWNHPCYFFNPHRRMAGQPLSSWAVPILPNGDFYIFLAKDFRFGIVGDCVNQTICVFGQQLLYAFSSRMPLMFKRLTWTAEERQEFQQKWAEAGWKQLSHEEKEERWNSFGERFQFFARQKNQQWPRILEPNPSMTWDISMAFASDARVRENLECDLTRKVLLAMCRVVQPDERIYSFHGTKWNEHYSFLPHRLTSVRRDAWALPVFPDDAYSIFVTSGMECGLFGDPIEQTVCVFGQNLLEAIRAEPPELFCKPIRTNGLSLQ